LPVLLLALALAIAGCSADCVRCGTPKSTANVQNADFNLCLSEFPDAAPEFSECTVVNIEYLVTD
jgi:hypothetical protein